MVTARLAMLTMVDEGLQWEQHPLMHVPRLGMPPPSLRPLQPVELSPGKPAGLKNKNWQTKPKPGHRVGRYIYLDALRAGLLNILRALLGLTIGMRGWMSP